MLCVKITPSGTKAVASARVFWKTEEYLFNMLLAVKTPNTRYPLWRFSNLCRFVLV
jgi:hypothetical protein